jgi:hypothetical protein
MKTIFSLMLFLLPMMCFAQKNVGEQKEQLKDYIEITNLDNADSYLRIDHGGKLEKYLILDGKKYYFESCISAVKFLESKGWKLEVAQISGNAHTFIIRYYLMSKVVTKEELEAGMTGVTEK